MEATTNRGDGAAWPVALLKHGTVKEQLSEVSFRLNESYEPFCSKVGIVSIGGTCREVQIIRDSVALQSIMCSSMVEWFEYVDTKEVRLIQEIFGAPVQIPLVKVEVDIAGRREKCLCVIVESLLPEVTRPIVREYCENLGINSLPRGFFTKW